MVEGPVGRSRQGGGGAGGGATPAAHRLYAQLAWPTLGGLPLLEERRATGLERELIALCFRLDVEPIEVRASADRVQLLVRFGPGQALSDVARRLKRASSAILRRWSSPARWGRGFAASTVGPGQVHRLVRRLRAERRAAKLPAGGRRAAPPGRAVPASPAARRGTGGRQRVSSPDG